MYLKILKTNTFQIIYYKKIDGINLIPSIFFITPYILLSIYFRSKSFNEISSDSSIWLSSDSFDDAFWFEVSDDDVKMKCLK